MTANISTGRAEPADAASRESFWSRIAGELAQAIGRGVYAPGQRLPSEHALAAQYAVNRHTIRRSLASLNSQGLVRITQGSGTYVEEFAVELALGRRTRHQQSMALAGLRGGLQVLRARSAVASARQAAELQLAPRSRLLCLQVLGMAGEQPLHVGERCFPLPRFAGLERVVRETGSITAGFTACGVADYTRRESRITAQLPDEATAALLRQPLGRPVLLAESINVDAAGVPIEFATTWFAGDRVRLTVSHDE